MEPVKLNKHSHEILAEYIKHPCFNPNLTISTAYQRPINREQVLKLDLSNPVKKNNITSSKNLLIQQLLFTIYEQDLLFLNIKDQDEYKQFKSFYKPEFVAYGKALKPLLEYLAFSFLDEEIEVLGEWNKQTLIKYLTETIEVEEQSESQICKALENSLCPIGAVKLLFTQMAPDFLSEASSMARTLPGSYGEEQSELMKVFIDEYGYGVHQTKHSTLFEETMLSVGLNPSIHHYYKDYYATSLMLVNYYHYISSNKAEWFKYVGTLYYTEASIPHINKQMSATFQKLVPKINTGYFDEHVHIDKHHRRMVLDKIIATSLDKYGEKIIAEFLIGFESFRLLQSLADQDIINQIQMMDREHAA